MASASPPQPSIRVLVDDLAFVEADAVVRPADEALDPASTAAARLDQLAGPGFAAQRRVAHPLEAGAAVVTGAGALTAGLVLHVVVRTREQPVARDTLRRGLASAWHRAVEWGLPRLAAPLLGAGPGQLGAEEAAGLMAETFLAHGGRAGWPTELRIVVEREDERELVAAVLRRHGMPA